MKEIIEKITTIHNFETSKGCLDGYLVETNTIDIVIGINNFQQCCESFGYMTTNDDLSDFINSQIIDITAIKENLNAENLDSDFCSNIMFLNINTTNGLLQLAVYNEHNGYYGHSAYVLFIEKNKDKQISILKQEDL